MKRLNGCRYITRSFGHFARSNLFRLAFHYLYFLGPLSWWRTGPQTRHRHQRDGVFQRSWTRSQRWKLQFLFPLFYSSKGRSEERNRNLSFSFPGGFSSDQSDSLGFFPPIPKNSFLRNVQLSYTCRLVKVSRINQGNLHRTINNNDSYWFVE